MLERAPFMPLFLVSLIRWAMISLLLALAGCGSATVEVVLPSNARTAVGAPAICQGVVAGEVIKLVDAADRVATIRLDSSNLTDTLMREGVKAWILDSGSIEFDVSSVQDDAPALPYGTRIVGERRTATEAAVQRWATGWNLTVIAAGLLAMLAMLAMARSVLRGAAALLRLALSFGVAAGIAYMAAPPLAPILENHVYPLLESAQEETPPIPPTRSETSVGTLEPRASSTLGAWSRQAAATLRNRSLPSPIYPAFFVVWLTSFMALASLLRRSARGS